MTEHDPDLPRILERIGRGDPGAWSEAVPRIYGTLKEIAHRFMGHQPRGHTLQTTALVHEAYVKLIGHDGGWESRRHFELVAARAMRHILVDHARAKRTSKRGGDREREELLEDAALESSEPLSALALHEALERLAGQYPEQAQVAELRCFSGLDHFTIAQVLDISERSVDRRWAAARDWLRAELADA